MKVNELQLLDYYSCFLFLSASVSFNQINFILDVKTEHLRSQRFNVKVVCECKNASRSALGITLEKFT